MDARRCDICSCDQEAGELLVKLAAYEETAEAIRSSDGGRGFGGLP